jgi:hypothetical protein
VVDVVGDRREDGFLEDLLHDFRNVHEPRRRAHDDDVSRGYRASNGRRRNRQRPHSPAIRRHAGRQHSSRGSGRAMDDEPGVDVAHARVFYRGGTSQPHLHLRGGVRSGRRLRQRVSRHRVPHDFNERGNTRLQTQLP